MSADADTIAYYEANAPRYTLSFGQGPSRFLDTFLDRLELGAEILELGCGSGRDSARMVERGFAVDPTDGTEAMARKARERFGLPARKLLFSDLDALSAYDAVWAHACLLHLPRADLLPVLRSIHEALRPGGLHFANYKLGDEAHPDEGRDPLGRWTNLPSPEWLEERYREAGFAILDAVRYRGEGADGVQRDWYALTVRRADD
ncbi:class I SAM-dependent methyltransferase [Qipengyuania seohaensis]|uniref:class I SAM-dependent methyltransferase n=1 Tax=Qipengyuania seohaensis TaxID=266951 RepID=UPI000C226943|nr:class I SAM-dependent methyltransferase [Qipengyuania seohaensis]